MPPVVVRLLGVTLSVTAACGWAATPRIEDAPALRDSYEQVRPSEKKCKRDILLLRADEAFGRAFQELATISATCYPGAPRVCEKRLLERACELGAEALILLEPKAEGSPPGASNQSLSSMSARAVTWKPDP